MMKSSGDTARHVRALIAALQSELALLRRMHHLSNLLSDALRRNDIEAIPALDQALERAAGESTTLESMRSAAANALAARIGRSAERLDQLILLLPEQDARRLKELQRAVLDVHARLRATQEINRNMAANGLGTVRLLLRLMARTAQAPITYGRAITAPAANLFVDRRA